MEIVYRGGYTISIGDTIIDQTTWSKDLNNVSMHHPHRYLVSLPGEQLSGDGMQGAQTLVMHIPTPTLSRREIQELSNAVRTIMGNDGKKPVALAFVAIDTTISEWKNLLQEIPCTYVVPMFTKPRNTVAPDLLAFAREVMLANLAVPKLLQQNQYIIV